MLGVRRSCPTAVVLVYRRVDVDDERVICQVSTWYDICVKFVESEVERRKRRRRGRRGGSALT